MPQKKALTIQEAQTLLYLLKNAQWNMNTATVGGKYAWPTDMVGEAIFDMWSGFWYVVPVTMVTEVRG